MSDILALLKEKIDGGYTLTDIEFQMCSDELKELYIKDRVKKKCALRSGELDWCSDSLMVEILDIYIDNFYVLDEFLFEKCSEEQLRRYFTEIMNNEDGGNYYYYEYNCEYCPEDMKQQFLDTCIKRGDEFEYNKFEEFTITQKLNYIILNGLAHLEQPFEDWYKKWLLAKGRDYQIDSIFEELNKDNKNV